MPRWLLFLKYWLPLIIWAFFIFYLSSQTDAEALGHELRGLGPFILRKIFHGLEYAILAVLIFRTLGKYKKSATPEEIQNLAAWSVLLALLYAFSDETHQTFIPGRDGQVADVFFDLAGSFLGLASWLKLTMKNR